MQRPGSDLIESLTRNWQVLLIASLPGSMLRIWAVMNPERLAAAPADPSMLLSLAQWSSEHGLTTLLIFPVITVALALLSDRRIGERSAATRTGEAAAFQLRSLDQLSPAARELLCAASFGGRVQLERRRSGLAVVVSEGRAGRDDTVREFHQDADPEVARRYRTALAELEQAGLMTRGAEGSTVTASGWTAAKVLNRRELDRLAARARHLSDAELALLRIVAECQRQHNAHKIALYRDGTRISAIFGNGQAVVVPGLDPLARTYAAEGAAASDGASFEALVQGIPPYYLAPLAGQLPRNPFLVRVTDSGLRYIRHLEVIHRDRAAA